MLMSRGPARETRSLTGDGRRFDGERVFLRLINSYGVCDVDTQGNSAGGFLVPLDGGSSLDFPCASLGSTVPCCGIIDNLGCMFFGVSGFPLLLDAASHVLHEGRGLVVVQVRAHPAAKKDHGALVAGRWGIGRILFPFRRRRGRSWRGVVEWWTWHDVEVHVRYDLGGAGA